MCTCVLICRYVQDWLKAQYDHPNREYAWKSRDVTHRFVSHEISIREKSVARFETSCVRVCVLPIQDIYDGTPRRIDIDNLYWNNASFRRHLEKKATPPMPKLDENGNTIPQPLAQLEHRDGKFRYRTPFPTIRCCEDIPKFLKGQVFGRIDVGNDADMGADMSKGLEVRDADALACLVAVLTVGVAAGCLPRGAGGCAPAVQGVPFGVRASPPYSQRADQESKKGQESAGAPDPR